MKAHYCAFIISAWKQFLYQKSSMSILKENCIKDTSEMKVKKQKSLSFCYIVFDHQIIREDPSNGSLQLQQQHLIASFIKKGTNPLLVDICHIATPLQNNISIVTKNHP